MSYCNFKPPKSNWIDDLLITIIIVYLFLMLIVALTQIPAYGAALINPGDYNIPKDGITDCTNNWEALDANIVSGSTIILPPGADYYTNSFGGIIFTNTVHIIGSGSKFTCGADVGNSAALTFEGDYTILENFVIDCTLNHTDDNEGDFMDSGDSLAGYNHRRGILIQGDYTTCRNIRTTCCVVRIELNANYCSIDTCTLKNTSIKYGIEGRDGSDYNCYIYNNTDGATYEYYNIGPYSITRCY